MEKLMQEAREAMANSFSPYSNFKVGAAVLLKDGTIIRGCNVENASYGLCNCAERTALFTTYAQGFRKDDIVAFAISAYTKDPVSPCGACRQVMNELLHSNTPVFLTNNKGDVKETTVGDLLPYSFNEVE
ncbi:MAG: cytidine deaminase [bacterium]